LQSGNGGNSQLFDLGFVFHFMLTVFPFGV
jgi:hypothetical protein